MPSQSDLRYTFEPLVGNAEFEVVSFELKEAISAPFTLELQLISFDPDIDFGQLLDKPIVFTIWDGKGPVRHVHGLVSRFSQGNSEQVAHQLKMGSLGIFRSSQHRPSDLC
ncbi:MULTISPECIES: contractile injection system protein, VgrG/Pvc8 family [Pseudomonas]|uniref:contractile injection system protein, VgrG/Pvc8 family n=1 Tax=Pseudomonas mosselii TaxID=78327 RepID=UPI003D6458D1